MSDHTADDRDLITRYKAGSQSAAGELFDRYCEKLMRLARRRIGQRMASRVDPEDVIQSAFRTFFVRVRNDEFTFDGEDDLFKLLVRLTVNKALRQIAPNFVNTAVEIVKASSLLSAIGVGELLLTTQEIIGRTFKTMEFYALAGALYLIVNLAIGAGGWWLERRFRAR